MRKIFILANFIYNVLLQPFLDVICLVLINFGASFAVPFVFYLKPVFMLLFLASIFRFEPPYVSKYWAVVAFYAGLVLISFLRGFPYYSEMVATMVIMAMAFTPDTIISTRLQNRLYKWYMGSLVIVLLSGLAGYFVLTPEVVRQINWGQIELYKSGTLRDTLTQNFYSTTTGIRFVGVWGEPLYFAYSIVPLFILLMVKFRQKLSYKYLILVGVVAGVLALTSRAAFAACALVSIAYFLLTTRHFRRYFFPYLTIVVLLFGIASLVYVNLVFATDPSLRDRITTFGGFLGRVQYFDLVGFSIGNFSQYDPTLGYKDTTEIGVFPFIANFGIVLAAYWFWRIGQKLGPNLTALDNKVVVMSASLVAYLLTVVIAPQFLTLKTLYPFAAMYLLIMMQTREVPARAVAVAPLAPPPTVIARTPEGSVSHAS